MEPATAYTMFSILILLMLAKYTYLRTLSARVELLTKIVQEERTEHQRFAKVVNAELADAVTTLHILEQAVAK